MTGPVTLPALAALGFGRRYLHPRGRAHEMLGPMRGYLTGSILDVGAGGNARIFARELGAAYAAIDFPGSYKLTDLADAAAVGRFHDLESGALPLPDGAYDTVICTDVLEHLDRPHLLYPELFRVARQRVVVSLPNNWPGMLWSFLVGRNISHTAGYGLFARPHPTGQRHKFYFNLEEALDFLLGAAPPGFAPVLVEARFEHGNDGLLATAPGLRRFARLAGMARPVDARERFGAAGPAIWLAAKAAYLAFHAADILLTALLFGWGRRMRFYNLFARGVWVVFERKTPAA